MTSISIASAGLSSLFVPSIIGVTVSTIGAWSLTPILVVTALAVVGLTYLEQRSTWQSALAGGSSRHSSAAVHRRIGLGRTAKGVHMEKYGYRFSFGPWNIHEGAIRSGRRCGQCYLRAQA
jgi:hypothetical protein